MNRIIKIGMDVHTTNYTLCIFEPSFEHDGTVHCITQVKPEIKKIIHVIETFKKKHENEELILYVAMKQDVWDILYIMN